MAGKSVNKVILIGNLGKDPEVKFTPSGTPVAKIALATNERFKDKSGEWQDRTEWHNVVLMATAGRNCRRISEEGREGLYRRPAPDPLLGRQANQPEKIHDRSRGQ